MMRQCVTKIEAAAIIQTPDYARAFKTEGFSKLLHEQHGVSGDAEA